METCGSARAPVCVCDIAQRAAAPVDWALISLAPQQAWDSATAEVVKNRDSASRIVWLVDYEDDEVREAGRRAGVYACVCKENLLALRQLLSGSSEPTDADRFRCQK
jgi:hypothetical protein